MMNSARTPQAKVRSHREHWHARALRPVLIRVQDVRTKSFINAARWQKNAVA
jgi:hypothetical protein